jgi:hypothetical protein
MMARCKNGAFVTYFASKFTSASTTRNMASNPENEKEFSLSRYKARGCPSFIIEAHQTATDHPKNPGTITCYLFPLTPDTLVCPPPRTLSRTEHHDTFLQRVTHTRTHTFYRQGKRIFWDQSRAPTDRLSKIRYFPRGAQGLKSARAARLHEPRLPGFELSHLDPAQS